MSSSSDDSRSAPTASAEPQATAKKPQRGNPARRTVLLDAAVRVLDEKNIVDVTVDDIVQEAGVARGKFYIYFRDKYDILKALSDRLNEALFEESHLRLDRHTPPYVRIRASLRSVLDAWTKHAGIYRSMTQMALARPDFLELSQRNRMLYVERIRSDIERSIDRGHARPIDPAVTAKALSAMMDWFCLLWFGLSEEPYAGATRDIDHVADVLAQMWYRVVYASDPFGLHD